MRFTKTVFALLFLLPLLAIGQNDPSVQHQIDSLKKVIRTAKHDSVIVNAWKEWDNLIYITDPEMDLALNKRIDSLSSWNLSKTLTKKEKRFFLKARAYSLNCFGMFNEFEENYLDAINYYTEGLKISEQINDKPSITSIATNLGNVYFYFEDLDKAMKYYKKVLRSIEK